MTEVAAALVLLLTHYINQVKSQSLSGSQFPHPKQEGVGLDELSVFSQR